MKYLKLLPVLLFFAFAPAIARASMIGGVGGSKVTAGKFTTEFRTSYTEDEDGAASQDERWRFRQNFDYGFTDRYALRLILVQDNRKNDDLEHESIGLENRLHILDASEYGFDFGMRAAYKMKDGDKKPDSLALRFIEVVPFDAWTLTLNQFLKHDIGEDSRSGLGFESRVQIKFKWHENHWVGLESFNDFGRLTALSGYDDQSHTIGPVFKGDIAGLKYEAGYRAGISDGAFDHGLKLFLSKSF